MVAADQGDAVGVADLEGQEEEEGLDGVVAPVDEVAEEQVVLVGTLAPDLEQLDEVVELPVDVAAYLTVAKRRTRVNQQQKYDTALVIRVSLGVEVFDRPRSVVIRHEITRNNRVHELCTSPHCQLTVTGASTRWTLLSSTRISLARRHRAFTSPSRRYSHRLSRSICSSREELHTAAAAGGAAVADWARTEAETEGAPTDAVAAGVGGATAADAMLLGLLLVCGPRLVGVE